jgi:hypothetical protein
MVKVRRVMKTEDPNAEFGHKWGEIFFKSCKKVH